MPSGPTAEAISWILHQSWGVKRFNPGAGASFVPGQGSSWYRVGRGIQNEISAGSWQQLKAHLDPRELLVDRAAGGQGSEIPQPGGQLEFGVSGGGCCDLQELPVEGADQPRHFAFSAGFFTRQDTLERPSQAEELPNKQLSSFRSHHSGGQGGSDRISRVKGCCWENPQCGMKVRAWSSFRSRPGRRATIPQDHSPLTRDPHRQIESICSGIMQMLHLPWKG